jgi:aminomethyltransferase
MVSLNPPQPRVLRPGMPALPYGTERYPVAGGGTTVFPVFGGDTVRVVDVEGDQVAEVVGFVDGRADVGLFDSRANGDAIGLRSLIASGGERNERLRRRLADRGLSTEGARSLDVLGHGSNPGEEVRLAVSADGVCVVTAVGGPMAVHEQQPPTELVVFVERADPERAASEMPDLPEPLADPAQDLRVHRASARAYEVKAGQWIQLIDVAGRQCSDFQAFRTSELERGVERCIDVTTSRTLMGQAYPQPGLHAKYYDVDMQPLVQVVQDNCQRHDAFALACNSKYYEELGYFGHINCTDNFNGALDPYEVAPRRAWASMNFFYNTGIDDQNLLDLDEPWSRPGDYVLMRALTDLVCVSSACPDDIDPANGWNPTDIHVRVYDSDLEAKRSIGFRKRPQSEVEMTKETGFHPRTSALTRNFAEYNGYWIAHNFPNHGGVAEYWACRQKAAIMDLSALRKFEVLGPDAESLLQYCLTRNVRKLAPGQVSYTAMCYDTGTMIDDGTVFRLGQDNFRWIGGGDYGGDWLREQARACGFDVRVKSATDQLHNVSVQGPNSRDILKQIVWTRPDQPTVEELGLFRFSIGRLHHEDGTPVIVSRTGYTGELGYEVFCHPNDAVEVWDEIWKVGEPLGLTPMGLEALDMLRVEAGLVFANHEFDDQTDPFEAGIGFTVPLKTKDEDFIGRDALIKRKENPQRRLVGLELTGNEVAAHGDCVHVGRHQVGTVTSGVRSPVLQKNIALCRMAVEYAEPGTEVEVGKLDGHQKRLPATVVPFPHYDPKKERMKM